MDELFERLENIQKYCKNEEDLSYDVIRGKVDRILETKLLNNVENKVVNYYDALDVAKKILEEI